jgi:rhodanese-related sulfurtransferase
LCACPEDAGAIQAARMLLGEGFLSVRPLKGGYEAWLANGEGASWLPHRLAAY